MRQVKRQTAMLNKNDFSPLHSSRRRAYLGASACAIALSSQLNLAFAQSNANFEQSKSDPEPLIKGPQAIAQLLKIGGYAIYMRHGITDRSQIAMERNHRRAGTFDFKKCDTQRMLSDEGRHQLRTAGMEFRKSGVLIDQKLSSHYCRAMESAQFFVDDVKPVDVLSNEGEVGLNPANKPNVQALFRQVPKAGHNHFYMAHGGIFWEATGFTIMEAHAVMLNPSRLDVLTARIAPTEWEAIAAQMKS